MNELFLTSISFKICFLVTVLQTDLSVSRDGFVHFGDSVLLINPGEEDVSQALQQVSFFNGSLATHLVFVSCSIVLLYNRIRQLSCLNSFRL